jgi:hypothetical protein
MDRYQRVEKPREEAAIGANEIRITAQGRTRNYITYALALLQVNAPTPPRFRLLSAKGTKSILFFFVCVCVCMATSGLGFGAGSVRCGHDGRRIGRCWLG